MEGKKDRKRAVVATLKAAVWGVAVIDGGMLLLQATATLSTYMGLSKLWDDWFGLIPFLLAVPTIYCEQTLGWGRRLSNPYFVNGLIGALLFASVSAFWQLAPKDQEKQ